MRGTTQRSQLTDPDWLTVRSIADRLSVSQSQVRKWMESGLFDEIVVFSPRLTRISKASFDRFMQKIRAA